VRGKKKNTRFSINRIAIAAPLQNISSSLGEAIPTKRMQQWRHSILRDKTEQMTFLVVRKDVGFRINDARSQVTNTYTL